MGLRKWIQKVEEGGAAGLIAKRAPCDSIEVSFFPLEIDPQWTRSWSAIRPGSRGGSTRGDEGPPRGRKFDEQLQNIEHLRRLVHDATGGGGGGEEGGCACVDVWVCGCGCVDVWVRMRVWLCALCSRSGILMMIFAHECVGAQSAKQQSVCS